MAIKISHISIISFIVLAFVSCTAPKNYIYLQDKGNTKDSTNKTSNSSVYKIKPKDILYIKTISVDQSTTTSLNSNEQANSITSEIGAYMSSYDVSDSGFVNLPMLGKINVNGLSVDEAQKAIQQKVNFYLKNALVVVKLLSFNITVLGEVMKPGTFPIYKTKINILEAMALAGDLTINGNRTQIKLIKQSEPNNIINIDITNKNLLQSDYYYLSPGDIIYVKPNRSKFFGTNPFPFATVVSSITTLILILNYIHK